MYNNSIPIYERESILPFINVFYDLTDYIEKTVIEISKTECFLDGEYKDKFIQYLYGDFSNFLNNSISELKNYDIKKGFKPIL